jgi:hypothetical protein
MEPVEAAADGKQAPPRQPKHVKQAKRVKNVRRRIIKRAGGSMVKMTG